MSTTATRVKGSALMGDHVTYEDMANPPKTYKVVGVRTQHFGSPSNPFRFAATDFRLREIGTRDETFSDLRQYGWTFAERNWG